MRCLITVVFGSFLFLNGCIPIRMIGYTFKVFPKEKLELRNDEIVSIPFETKRNLIIVNAELDGKKGKFLFDSGAFGLADSTFTVDIHSKKKYEVLKGETRPDNDILVSYNLNKYKKIGLGNIELKNIWMGEMFMDNLPEHSCYFDGGIIGLNFFDKSYVMVNNKSSKIIITKKKENFSNFENYQAIANNQKNIQGSKFIKLKVNNLEFNLLVDFGFGGGILLHQNSIKDFANFGILDKQTLGVPFQTGSKKNDNNFPSIHYYDFNAKVNLYKYEFNYPITIISNGNHSPRFPMDGLIGVDFLKHLNPVFDLVDDQVWLQLGLDNIQNMVENVNTVGFEEMFYINNGKLSLYHIDSSMFDTTIFKTESDMNISMFNGVLVEELTNNEWCNDDFIDNLKALKTDSIYLEMINGNKLTLPKY